jgi:hypothetical protein
MANQRDAEAARTLWADRLTAAGAHSISVEPETPGARNFVLVAWVKKPPTAPLPTVIEVKRSGARRMVPLRIRMVEPVAPEAPGG